jgi:hypothetical protein
MAVPEADHVHRLVREGGHAAVDRGAARAVAVHHPDAHAAQREDAAPSSEPSHEGGRIVVARDRLEGCHLFEESRHLRAGKIPQVQDQGHALAAQTALERRGQPLAEAGQVGVRHDRDLQRAPRGRSRPRVQRRVTFAATHTQPAPCRAHTSV